MVPNSLLPADAKAVLPVHYTRFHLLTIYAEPLAFHTVFHTLLIHATNPVSYPCFTSEETWAPKNELIEGHIAGVAGLPLSLHYLVQYTKYIALILAMIFVSQASFVSVAFLLYSFIVS